MPNKSVRKSVTFSNVNEVKFIPKIGKHSIPKRRTPKKRSITSKRLLSAPRNVALSKALHNARTLRRIVNIETPKRSFFNLLFRRK